MMKSFEVNIEHLNNEILDSILSGNEYYSKQISGNLGIFAHMENTTDLFVELNEIFNDEWLPVKSFYYTIDLKEELHKLFLK